MLSLEPVSRTDPRVQANMRTHYSQPKGFMGRSLIYLILYAGVCYGTIAGGSCTLHLPGRNEFFGITPENRQTRFKQIVNNVFYHVEKIDGKYPIRNFVPAVLKAFRDRAPRDWLAKYGDEVIGFESLVELPRTGEIYLRDGWTMTGITKGFTCKRISEKVAGKPSTDKLTGTKVWDTKNLRPKKVFCRKVDACPLS
jgi:hypothetical protein